MNRQELAIAYLLDELDRADRDRVERRLGHDPDLRTEVESLRPLVGKLDRLPEDAWPADPVSAGVAAAARGGSAGARRWSLRPAVALATLLVVAALGAGLGVLLSQGDSTAPPNPVAVLRPLKPVAGEEATVAMPAANEMLFRAKGLPALGAGQYYEIWLMTDPRRSVPVASFRVDPQGEAVVRVPLPADPTGYRYFDVSRQRVGDGTGHSSSSVLRGPIV
jgi:anti-sigma-K factor RskA